jgi:hypothetical protein
MRVVIGADHAGYKLKERVKDLLAERHVPFEDIGTNSEQSVDYPDYAVEVAKRVASGAFTEGILVCGTGIGMAIAANKIAGIRAARAGSRPRVRPPESRTQQRERARDRRPRDAAGPRARDRQDVPRHPLRRRPTPAATRQDRCGRIGVCDGL